jgi:formate hydrogenlyase subunit 3/multisubunit Na+/H+ antiporter MnhD subunit
MAGTNNVKALRVALVAIGIIFIVGVYPLTIFWPEGWIWHTNGQSNYLQMILGIYVTLGVFLLLAARNPLKNLSLIWFTVWSSIAHGVIMAAQARAYPEHRGHLLGDVPALLLIAIVLALLTPKTTMAEA